MGHLCILASQLNNYYSFMAKLQPGAALDPMVSHQNNKNTIDLHPILAESFLIIRIDSAGKIKNETQTRQLMNNCDSNVTQSILERKQGDRRYTWIWLVQNQ